MGASEEAFRAEIDVHYGSPETMAEGGSASFAEQRYGVAMLFYAKSIDMLHSAYGFEEMRSRQPSPSDLPIVDGFCRSLAATLAEHPDAPVAECVRETTHRLRSITVLCERVGLPAGLYRGALQTMSEHAPTVLVDDIQWA